ncbi:MAG: MFS transporter [bacterium]
MSTVTPEHRWWRYRIFVLTWVGYASFYLCRKNFAIAKNPLSELGFDNLDLAWIWTLFLLMYALFQFVSGYLGDIRGPRFMVGTGMLIVVLTNLLAGFYASLLFLCILMAINGIAQTTGWPNCVKCMGSWFVIRERGRVMGWYCTCYAAGGVIAALYATRLYEIYRDHLLTSAGEEAARLSAWKIIFIGPALTLLVIAVIFILFVRNRPTDAGLKELDEFEGLENRVGSNSASDVLSEKEEKAAFRDALREVLRNRTVWTFCAVYFCMKFIRYGMLSWLPRYASQELNYNFSEAGYLSVGFEIAGPLGVLFCGYVSDWVFKSRRGPVCTIGLALLTLFCLLESQIAYWGMGWYFLGLCLIGFTVFGPDALIVGAAAQDFGGKRATGTCTGLINGVGSLGAVLQEILIGWATKNFQNAWSWLFYVFAGLALIAMVLMATTWNAIPKAHAERKTSST